MSNSNHSKKNQLLLYRIAKHYYVDFLSQKEISILEHISRPHVSRLLKQARERGIVNITVALPEYQSTAELADELKKATGLDFVQIVEIDVQRQNLEQQIINSYIAIKAAEVMNDYLSDSQHIGIGWGETVYLTSKELNNHFENEDKKSFTPIIGLSDASSPNLQTNVIVERFAEKFNGQANYINLPVIVSQESMESDLNCDRIKRMMNHWSKIDTVIIGLGRPILYEDYIDGVSMQSMKRIRNSDTVGDILASYITSDGREIEIEQTLKKVSISLDHLTEIRKVLCLAGGLEKVGGIATAIKYNYINGLVTDRETADNLLHLFRNK